MTLERFEMLEEGLTKLLDGYEQLKTENQDLKTVIGAKELEIRELQGKMKELDKERNMVREKVDKLLGRLDSIVQGAGPLQGA